MTEPTLAIRAATMRGTDALWLEYEVANPAGGTPVFLFNLLGDKYKQLSPPPNQKATPELAQTCYAGDETVLLLQGRVPTPGGPHMTFYAPIVPLCTRVAPGKALRATIRAPVPLLEWTVYNGPERDPAITQPTLVRQARLVVEWMAAPAATYAQPEPTVPDSFRVSAAGPIQRLTATIALATPVTLLLRTNEFKRFG